MPNENPNPDDLFLWSAVEQNCTIVFVATAFDGEAIIARKNALLRRQGASPLSWNKQAYRVVTVNSYFDTAPAREVKHGKDTEV